MLDVRNLCVARVKVDPSLFRDLPELLASHAVTDPGPLEIERAGFTSCVKGESDLFVRAADGVAAFAFSVRKRVLPASVINERVGKKVEKARERGEHVSARGRRKLRAQAQDELLPQAFIVSQVSRCWLDRDGWFVVESSSMSKAEHVMTKLREILGSFPAVWLRPEAPRLVLTQWLRKGPDDAAFGLGNDCTLVHDGSASWTGQSVELLGSEEVKEHLDAGAHVKRLGMTYMDRLSFTFGDDGIIRKFRLLETAIEDKGDSEDALSEFDAGLVLVSGEVRSLLEKLNEVFNCAAEPE